MRKIRLIIMSLVIMVPMIGLAQAEKSVTLTEPGTLLKAIGEDNLKNIEKLTVAGPVNSTDFATMKTAIDEGKLRTIDLLKADPENNEIPAQAFSQPEVKIRQTRMVLPENLEVIGEYAFSKMAFDEIVFNNKLREIKREGFSWCYFYQRNLSLPASIRELGDRAFYLVETYGISLPEGLEKIGSRCFDSVWFEDLVLPSTLRQIGNCAYFYTASNCPCSNIKGDVYVKATVPPVCDMSFDASPVWAAGPESHALTLYVPVGTLETYKTTPGWNHFYNYKEFDVEEFDKKSGIRDISSSEAVSFNAYRSESGELVIEATPKLEKECKVIVYGLQGHKKIRARLSAGSVSRYTLPSGLYIVVCGDRSMKVMI